MINMKLLSPILLFAITDCVFGVNTVRQEGYDESIVDVAQRKGLVEERIAEVKGQQTISIPGYERAFCHGIAWSKHSSFLRLGSVLAMEGEYLRETHPWNDPEESNPPLGVPEAISVALEWVRKVLPQVSWRFDSLTIDTAIDDDNRCFVYTVTVHSVELRQDLTVAILPNGTVVEPISWDEVMRRHNEELMDKDMELRNAMERRKRLAGKFPTRQMDLLLNEYLSSGINYAEVVAALGEPDLYLSGQSSTFFFRLNENWVLVVVTPDMDQIYSIDYINEDFSHNGRIYYRKAAQSE